MIKNNFSNSHFPHLKPTVKHRIQAKYRLPLQSKRDESNFLPPIVTNHSPRSTLVNDLLTSSTNPTEGLTSTLPFHARVHEAAERFLLRHKMAKLSQGTSSNFMDGSFHSKRTTLYDHVQAKIDTGLSRNDTQHTIDSNTHQLEPNRSVKWHTLKHEIEQDFHIRTHAKRIHFNSDTNCKNQLTTLGTLVRSKVKSHLSSPTGSGDERYKIVVHLTAFQAKTVGLHVLSRCLWDIHTDNSITLQLYGVDCNILIVVFLCYTDIGAQ